ncbi:hypothetical protein GQ457_13G022970 [Hibiscus cannabinus]
MQLVSKIESLKSIARTLRIEQKKKKELYKSVPYDVYLVWHLKPANWTVMALFQPFSDTFAVKNMRAGHPGSIRSAFESLQTYRAIVISVFHPNRRYHLPNGGFLSRNHAVIRTFHLFRGKPTHNELKAGRAYHGSRMYHRIQRQDSTVEPHLKRPFGDLQSPPDDGINNGVVVPRVDPETGEDGSENLVALVQEHKIESNGFLTGEGVGEERCTPQKEREVEG